MRNTKTGNEIDDIAAQWVARRDGGTLSHEDQMRLDAWLERDPRHKGAFVRAMATWRLLDQTQGLPHTTNLHRSRNRRVVLMGGIAATMAGVAFSVWRLSTARLTTEMGEVSQQALHDGSSVALDTESVVSTEFEEKARRIRLERGRALFDVAKDAHRPFVVEAGLIRVQAVGTAFSVQRLKDATEVVVSEGVVAAWNAQAPHNGVHVAAGQMVRLSDDAARQAITQAVSPEQINQKMAWRIGQIILSNDTLAEAATEFNRYNTVKIVIDDPHLAVKTLAGGFRTTDPEGFAKVAADVLHAHWQRRDDTIVLYR